MEPPIKIQIASDLHLEGRRNRDWLNENPLIPEGDVLLLAGDIVVKKYESEARAFYEKVRSQFDLIIETMGNHEFYGGEVAHIYPEFEERCAVNHVRLNNRTWVHGGVKFIVTVLWTHVPETESFIIERGLNDYHLIRYDGGAAQRLIDTNDTNEFNAASVAFLENELQKPHEGKVVVMTHHLPSFRTIHKKYNGHPLNAAFANHLDDIIRKHTIHIWVHGHSHDFFDKVIDGTRIVRNPMFEVPAPDGFALNREFVLEL
ncbi:MAG: metallophosphoesterase [Planctomycetota bacterium]